VADLLLSPIGLGGIAAVLIVLTFVFRRRGRGEAKGLGRELHVDLASLTQEGPPASGPQLECRRVKVRLALVVLAPVGRASTLATGGGLDNLLEQIVPGLGEVFNAQRPPVKLWPPQLSHTGFTASFFKNVPLPGNRGRGTPWCSLAGTCEIECKNVNVGLVMCAAKPNNLGQEVVQHTHGWSDELRVV